MSSSFFRRVFSRRRPAFDDDEKESAGQEFIEAAKFGDVKTVKRLLKLGVPADYRGEHDLLAIHHAARRGHMEVLKILVTPENVNSVCRFEKNALMRACSGNQPEIVQYLLNCKADINYATSSGHTALMRAASEGNVDCVDILLSQKVPADIHATTDSKTTAFTFAARSQHITVMIRLLKNHPPAVIDTPDEYGNIPLHFAAFADHVEVVRFLVEHNSNLFHENHYEKTPLEEIIDDKRQGVVAMFLHEEMEKVLLEMQESLRETVQYVPEELCGVIIDFLKVPELKYCP